MNSTTALILQLNIEARTHRYEQKAYVEEIVKNSELYAEALELDMFDNPDEEDQKLLAKIWLKLISFLLVQKGTHPRTLIAMLLRYLDDVDDAAEFLEQAIEYNIIGYDHRSGNVFSYFTLDKDEQTEIDQFGFPYPLVCKPMILTDARQTGYHSELAAKGTALSKNTNPDKRDLNLDFLNMINSTELVIVKEVIEGVELAEPVREDGEAATGYFKKLKAYNKYCKVLDESLETFEECESLWLTHFYDNRGRIYTRGYHWTYQGADWNKAAITLNEFHTI